MFRRVSLFPVLCFVTVGRWVIGTSQNGCGEGMLDLLLCRSLEFLVLVLLMVQSAHRQQGRRLRVLGTNCSLYESEFRLCSKVVVNWLLQYADE